MTAFLNLNVELIGIRPRVWRSFLFPAFASFQDLHVAIQVASGWSDTERCSFHLAKDAPAFAEYVEDDDEYDEGAIRAQEVGVASVLGLQMSRSCLQRTGQFEWTEDYAWQLITLIAVVDYPGPKSRVLTGGYGTYPKFPWWTQDDYHCALAGITGTHSEGGELSENLRDEILLELDGWRPDLFDLETLRRTFDK